MKQFHSSTDSPEVYDDSANSIAATSSLELPDDRTPYSFDLYYYKIEVKEPSIYKYTNINNIYFTIIYPSLFVLDGQNRLFLHFYVLL